MLDFYRNKSATVLEGDAIQKAVERVIDERTYYGSAGHPNVKKLEEALAERSDGRRALCVNSGTDALILALKLLRVGPGDEVIVPAFSYVSTASCVSWIGAKPVFADICLDDYAVDPATIEANITPKTKAIIVAHLFGQPASGIEEIARIAKRRSLYLIEDAAQSFGAKIEINGEGKPVGAIGDIGCLSFSSTKPFAAPGNGGALILKDPALWEEGDRMRFYGARVHHFDYPTVGVNCKMHDLQAAALLAKLPFFDYWLGHRRRIAALYTKELAGIGDLVLPADIPGTERTWYRYVVRTSMCPALFEKIEKTAMGSSRLFQLARNYPVPLPYFSIFRNSRHIPGDFPVADRVSQEAVPLPVTNDVTTKDAERFACAVQEFFNTRI